MLIVVEDGDIEFLLESLFDLKAARSGNVLEIDSAKSSRYRFHCANNLIRIFRVQTNRKRVDASELFEQHRLPFHDWHRCSWSNVAESQNCGPVGYNCYRVLLDRKCESFVRVLMNRLTNPSYTWRVSH